MDKLQRLAHGHGFLRGVLGFLVLSVLIVAIGFALGVFDYSVFSEGGVKVIYERPAGERRF